MMQVAYITDASGDWEGLYIDGKLVDEGHSLSVRDVLAAVGVEFSSREIDMKNGSHLPENLEEVS